MEPQITAQSPVLPSDAASASSAREPTPTFKISAAATPSGYGRSESVTSARRSGMVYITPKIPPTVQMPADCQNGKPVHQPTMTRPGRTKMIDDKVPADDATVWTMLFSKMLVDLNIRSTAMEMTAAGMEEAKVRPTFRPR